MFRVLLYCLFLIGSIMLPSQRARGQSKPLGRCSVCKFNFRVQDRGLIHRPGTGNTKCPGSNQPPECIIMDASQADSRVDSHPRSPPVGSQSMSFGLSQSGDLNSQPTGSAADADFSHFSYLQDNVRLLSHIPKSARVACGSKLSQIIQDLSTVRIGTQSRNRINCFSLAAMFWLSQRGVVEKLTSPR